MVQSFIHMVLNLRYTFYLFPTTGELSQVPVAICRVSPQATRRPAEKEQRSEGVFKLLILRTVICVNDYRSCCILGGFGGFGRAIEARRRAFHVNRNGERPEDPKKT